jgi:hypothetical protein
MRFLDVARRTFEADIDDFAVVGEVGEFGRSWFELVVKQVNRVLKGRLTTLRRWCRVGGNGLLLVFIGGCGCRWVELGAQGRVSRQKLRNDPLFQSRHGFTNMFGRVLLEVA